MPDGRITPADVRIPRLGAGTVPGPERVCLDEDEGVLLEVSRTACGGGIGPVFLEMAGARRNLFFEPRETRAAIVTCGGLCPGLNDVIRGLTMVLWYRYGVRAILGIRYGYAGMVADTAFPPLKLTPEAVEDIHQDGGTVLGSSRGPQDIGAMVDFLAAHRVQILFTVGGDGTQKGALAITEEIERRGLAIAVVGIPKTIDNDIALIDRTFGFLTAVAMSQGPIQAAHMEAQGVLNGIGLVKLMGRDSGFIAAYASLASSDVNLVLIPEVPFRLEKLGQYLEERLAQKRHAVVVAAEGAGGDLVPPQGRDASGNVKLGDIGLFLKERIEEHLTRRGVPHTIKYLDPSYSIRSAPAAAGDSVFCFQLALYAVHAAMTGRTGMVVGTRNGQFVHVPMPLAVRERKKVDIKGLLWQSVLDNTGQPDLA